MKSDYEIGANSLSQDVLKQAVRNGEMPKVDYPNWMKPQKK